MFSKSPKNILCIIVLFLLLPSTNSCSDPNDVQPEKPGLSSKEKFYLGLIPEQDLFSQKDRYTPLARYLSEKAGLDVEVKILSRYGNIIDNFISGQLDGAFFGSFTGALAISKLGVEPLARPLWLDGTSTYYGMVFTRKDRSIKNAQDMKGKRFVFVDKATTAGWLLPLHYFHELSIEDYRQWFSETYFTGTHEDAIKDVLEGKADLGAAKNTVFYRLAEKNPKITLKNILLQMHEDKQGREILNRFGARRFIETTKFDYGPVFTYANKISLDLKKYDYRND